MRDEVLEKVLSTDATVVPRYDIVKPDGTKVAENVQVVLKNNVLVQGTPLSKQNLLKDNTATALGLNPTTATPSDALQAIRDSISYCPKLKVKLLAGGTVYIKNMSTEIQQSYTMPASGVLDVDIKEYGTYAVWGMLGDVTTSTSTVVIDTTKLYTLDITYYTCIWKFSVSEEIGATIRVTHTDGTVATGTVGADKTCSIGLLKTGTWTAVGVYDNCNSNTVSINITDADDGTTRNTTLSWVVLTVNVDSGSLVTVAAGSTTKGGTSSSGVYKCWLPFTSTWIVTASLGSNITSGTVNAAAYTSYSLSLNYFVTYGIRIPITYSAPDAAEYTDGATGMTPGYTSWENKNIFRDIKPCVLLNGVVQYYLNKTNLTQKADGTPATINSVTAGDVMVEVPKIGYRIYADASYLYVKITDNPNAADFCYLAHSLDVVNDCDKIYYGAYLAFNSSSKLYSVSGISPVSSITLANARAYAAARGTGYQQMSFYPWVLLQCLYLIMYKNLNAQSAIGAGLTNTTYPRSTGGTNAKGPCFGETTGNFQMSFLNIEDFWGNYSSWLDGLATDSGFYIRTDYKNFADGGPSYTYITDSKLSAGIQGFLTAVQGSNNTGFIPRAVGGSASTYFCDYGFFNSNALCYVGGPYNALSNGGPFYMYLQTAAAASEYISARLMYKHKGV